MVICSVSHTEMCQECKYKCTIFPFEMEKCRGSLFCFGVHFYPKAIREKKLWLIIQNIVTFTKCGWVKLYVQIQGKNVTFMNLMARMYCWNVFFRTNMQGGTDTRCPDTIALVWASVSPSSPHRATSGANCCLRLQTLRGTVHRGTVEGISTCTANSSSFSLICSSPPSSLSFLFPRFLFNLLFPSLLTHRKDSH